MHKRLHTATELNNAAVESSIEELDTVSDGYTYQESLNIRDSSACLYVRLYFVSHSDMSVN